MDTVAAGGMALSVVSRVVVGGLASWLVGSNVDTGCEVVLVWALVGSVVISLHSNVDCEGGRADISFQAIEASSGFGVAVLVDAKVGVGSGWYP